jgi:hypothetical protein
LSLIFCAALRAQQPTGKGYEIKEPPKRASNAPTAQSPVTFTDISASVAFKNAASPTSVKYLPESMGAGAALLDYDNDGRLDIFFTNGAALQDPMPKGATPDKRDPKYWNRLFQQKADGTFADVTEKAGLQGVGYSMGAAAADFDNDGLTDLYVTGYNSARLYRNRGNGVFADVTAKLNAAASGWTVSAGWLDYDADGRLDLFVTRYLDWDFERGAIYCGDTRPGMRAYCHPDNFPAVSNILLHQKTDGTFEDASEKSGIASVKGKALGVAFADFNNDGWTDIFVANDSVRQTMFKNKGGGAFEEMAEFAGVGYDENGKTFAGMGVDTADFDRNGSPDIFITALSNETYPLYQNNGDDTFDFVTNRAGVALITLLNAGWGAKFIDFDNDGLRDIFVAQSHVLDTIEKSSSYLKYKQTPLLMRNTGKGFVEVSPTAGAAFLKPVAARGAACGDLDNDGDTDIVIGVLNDAPVILRNDGAKNRWLGLALQGNKSNREGLGARVTVKQADGRQQIFDVSRAGSYISSHDPRLLIGLGADATPPEITVRWPGGDIQTVAKPQIDRYIIVKQAQ